MGVQEHPQLERHLDREAEAGSAIIACRHRSTGVGGAAEGLPAVRVHRRRARHRFRVRDRVSPPSSAPTCASSHRRAARRSTRRRAVAPASISVWCRIPAACRSRCRGVYRHATGPGAGAARGRAAMGARRARQIDAVTFNVSGMYGHVEGLVPALPPIALLELPEAEMDAETEGISSAQCER